MKKIVLIMLALFLMSCDANISDSSSTKSSVIPSSTLIEESNSEIESSISKDESEIPLDSSSSMIIDDSLSSESSIAQGNISLASYYEDDTSNVSWGEIIWG